jgi:hypothetical protein
LVDYEREKSEAWLLASQPRKKLLLKAVFCRATSFTQRAKYLKLFGQLSANYSRKIVVLLHIFPNYLLFDSAFIQFTLKKFNLQVAVQKYLG